MELVLRVDGREVCREIKLTAPVKELLRRIEMMGAPDPRATLAYQLSREVAFQVGHEGLLAEILLELIKQPDPGV